MEFGRAVGLFRARCGTDGEKEEIRGWKGSKEAGVAGAEEVGIRGSIK